MYTYCIIVLMLISGYFIVSNVKLYSKKTFWFWLLISCMVGWLEFYFYLRYDSWIFDVQHILNVYIFGVTIEDILFCPCFSIIFWRLYFYLKKNWSQRKFNPDDKFVYAIIVIGIIVFNFNIGTIFGKYMAFRTGMGLTGLIYCWNYSSFRHSIIFMLIVFLIAAGWDVPFVNIGVWTYAKDIYNIPKIYDQKIYIIIYNAIFPIEIWSYYISGAMFSFWNIALIEKYFDQQKKIKKSIDYS